MKKTSLPPQPPKEYWQDYDWANQHYGELLKAYPNQWVGIHHKRVVAASRDGRKVEESLGIQFPGQQIPLVFVADASHIY
ncbi:MAG: DUF5678 domain-containing protein [Elusimicrobia bacterium]|nr:DUF5678 domain-containing protein [Candidatus Obscuribacterium magneticum]